MSFCFIPNDKVDVPEIPYKEQIEVPAADSALLVVDMQNDFVKEGGSLVCPAASETIPAIRDLLSRAREKKVKIAYTQDTAFEGDPEWEIWPEHCRIGTWGWEFIEELAPEEHDLICTKNRYDGFYGTWLEHFLSYMWGSKHVIIVGTVSNICVLHTAASAGLRWFHVVIPANGISALTEFDQALTLRQTSSLYSGHVVKQCSDITFV